LQALLSDFSAGTAVDPEVLLDRRQEKANALFRRIEGAYGLDIADASIDQLLRLIMLATGEDRKRDAGMVEQDRQGYLVMKT
jgi:hypothetical protein